MESDATVIQTHMQFFVASSCLDARPVMLEWEYAYLDGMQNGSSTRRDGGWPD